MIQAFFWDYDNTILATSEAHWNKHKTVLAEHGIALDEKHRERVHKNNGNKNWQWMNEELGLKVPQKEYLNAVDAVFQATMIELKIRPGVEKLFDLIKQKGIPQAVVTNARTASAKPVMDERGITQIMQFVLCREDYNEGKPKPDPYLTAFAKMEVITGQKIDPKRCIVIEDDLGGIESASEAGAITIHRKMREDDPAAPLANYTCFQEEEFVQIVTSLLEGLSGPSVKN